MLAYSPPPVSHCSSFSYLTRKLGDLVDFGDDSESSGVLGFPSVLATTVAASAGFSEVSSFESLEHLVRSIEGSVTFSADGASEWIDGSAGSGSWLVLSRDVAREPYSRPGKIRRYRFSDSVFLTYQAVM
jgi:hypothetical protein